MELDDIYVMCDFCDVEVRESKVSFYQLSTAGDTLDMCLNCYSNPSHNEPKLLSNIQFIDRTDSSIEDKPLRWKCLSCDKIMGGGHKWYTNNYDIDICEDCFHNGGINKYMKDCGLFVDINNLGNYKILDRCGYGVILATYDKDKKLDDVEDMLGDLSIDEPYISERFYQPTLQHNLYSAYDDDDEYISSLCGTDIKSSICDWIIFTTFKHYPVFIDFSAAFMINANNESIEYRNIALLVQDDHGRLKAFNICDNVYELKILYDDYLEHKSTYKKPTKEDERAFIEKIRENGDSVETEDALKLTCDFSTYLTLKKDIPFYFG
jgi:hypothetical protein